MGYTEGDLLYQVYKQVFEEFDKPKTKMFKEGKNLKFLFGNGRSVILSSISDEEVQFKFSTTDWEDVLNFLHNIEHLDKC